MPAKDQNKLSKQPNKSMPAGLHDFDNNTI
jgi:hypothetical protein